MGYSLLLAIGVSMCLNKYKAVIFDMDGVIFDSERCIIDCWKVLEKKYNIPKMEQILHKCLGVNRDEMIKIFITHLGEDFPYEERLKERSDIYHERYDDGRLPLKPGIRELLVWLKEKGYKIGVASSTRKAVVLKQLEDAGLLSYFDDITCGDMVERSKPEPDIYLMSCSKLAVKPEEAIAIEDSYHGIRSAYAAGMFPIMVPDLLMPNEDMFKLAGKICESLIDVKSWLETL